MEARRWKMEDGRNNRLKGRGARKDYSASHGAQAKSLKIEEGRGKQEPEIVNREFA
jgi:hypothetical protein